MHHGTGGGQGAGSHLNKMEKFIAAFPGVDVFFMGPSATLHDARRRGEDVVRATDGMSIRHRTACDCRVTEACLSSSLEWPLNMLRGAERLARVDHEIHGGD